MIMEWVKEKAIEVIINPQKILSDGQIANIIPVVTPGGSPSKEQGPGGGISEQHLTYQLSCQEISCQEKVMNREKNFHRKIS